MSEENESVLVKLTRMEGKLDLSNLRHEQHDAKFAAIDGRLSSHGERLTGLETREHERAGERKGITMSGKLIGWGLSLLIGAGGGAALLELLR